MARTSRTWGRRRTRNSWTMLPEPADCGGTKKNRAVAAMNPMGTMAQKADRQPKA